MAFDKLILPSKWEHYWSKHPEGYTILEALFQWVHQVNAMVDNVNDWNDYLQDFVDSFDKELQESVIKVLGEWQADGTLTVLINEALQTQIDEVQRSVEDRGANVKDFGAVGDGVTNDTLAFQRALDTKGKVFIPEGDYLITDTLLYYSKQEIEGIGDKSNLISNVLGKPVMKNVEATFNTNFHKFRIIGTGNEINGIEMSDGYEHMTFNQVSLIDIGGNALHLKNVYGVYTDGLHIICENDKTENAIYAYGVNGARIAGAVIKGCNHGIHTDWTYKFTIKDSIIESNKGTGIYMQRPHTTTIRDVYFENNAINKELDNAYDIHLDDNTDNLATNHFKIEDCYARSNNAISTVKVNTKVTCGHLSNFYVIGFENDYQEHMFDIDLKGSGSFKLESIDSTKVNYNDQENLIQVTNDTLPIRTHKPIKLQYMDSSTGSVVDGEIPCTINYHHVQFGGLTQVNFEFKSIDASSVPTNRLVTISLPIKRSVYSGFFTTPLHYNGSDNDEVLGLYGVIDNKNYITVQKIGTPTNTSTRFDTENLTSGITAIKGSITYY